MDDCCVASSDREHAVEVVAQVYERIKIQQPLLLLHCSSLPPSATTQLAQSLLSEALRALNVALSVMNQQQQQPSHPAPAATPTSVVKAEPPSHGAAPDPDEPITSTASRRGKRRRTTAMEAAGKTKTSSSSSSWAGLTAVPYEDGYEWRKYGEKKINGTIFTRSYFRCTYKDDTGCLATKHVQQKDTSDPPVFQVTYNNNHTCRFNSSERVISIKQEEPPAAVLTPPLVVEASSALAAFDHHGRHTPPSTTSSSCISGESCCDGYYSAPGDMAAEEASPGEEDFLHDLELFLLCDSFKDY